MHLIIPLQPFLFQSGHDADMLDPVITNVCLSQVETKTKAEIEEKKKQLRQLVGNSYK